MSSLSSLPCLGYHRHVPFSREFHIYYCNYKQKKSYYFIVNVVVIVSTVVGVFVILVLLLDSTGSPGTGTRFSIPVRIPSNIVESNRSRKASLSLAVHPPQLQPITLSTSDFAQTLRLQHQTGPTKETTTHTLTNLHSTWFLHRLRSFSNIVVRFSCSFEFFLMLTVYIRQLQFSSNNVRMVFLPRY